MNYRLRMFIVDMIDIIQRFIVAYTIITVSLYHIDEAAALYNLGLLPIPFLSYLIQKKAKHIWSYFLLHLLLFPIYIVTTFHAAAIILFCLYIIITTILHFYGKQKAIPRNSLFLLIIFAVLYIGAASLQMTYLTQFTFYMTILYTLLCIINSYLLNYCRYFQINDEVENVPYQQIKNTNNSIMLFLGGSLLIVMLLFYRLPLNPLLAEVGRFILRIILSPFFLFKKEEPTTAEAPVETESFAPYIEPSPILEFISRLLEVLVIVICAIFIIILIAYLVNRLYKIMHRYFNREPEHGNTDKIEFLNPFVKKGSVQRASHKPIHRLFNSTNDGSIRKLFYKAVASSTKDATMVQKHLTPSELTELLKLKNSGDDPAMASLKKNRITEYYEKARYSEEECSKEEVKRMKELLR